MNDLYEEFESKGLTIVGVTSESKSSTEPWIEQHQASYPYAYDKKGSLMRYFGARGYPSAVLIDPSGTVVWQDHPARLTGSIIEKALVGAFERPLWEWPSETKKLQGYLKKGNYAKALDEAGKHEGPYKDIVTAQIAAKLDAVKSARESGDFLGAKNKGDLALKQLKGLPETDEIAVILKEIAKDPEAKRVMKGQKKLAGVQAEISEIKSKSKAKKMLTELEDLRELYAGTIIETEAKSAMAELRNRYKV